MRPEPLRVGEVVEHLAAVIRDDPLLADVAVRGELSNFRRHSSGHCYFTLKDADSQLRCVMFRREADALRFDPADGLAVIAEGRVDVYQQRGEVQLYVRAMAHDGLGALYEAYERLRARLADEGLFDPARKRPLPAFPRRVAVITSPTGAAVRDMIEVLRDRWPAVRIVFQPAAVQGDEAAASLVRALDLVNRAGGVEVILFGRGGGSIEDLWAFNEEPVARAVAASGIPVISAVGHESDVTICDFVADARAATPTHAAELAVPDQRAVSSHLRLLERRLHGAAARVVETARARLDGLAARRVLAAPEALLEQRAQRVDDLADRLTRAALATTRQPALWLAGMSQTLAALDPHHVLGRGYAILTRSRDGSVVTEPAAMPSGEAGVVRVAQGGIAVTAN